MSTRTSGREKDGRRRKPTPRTKTSVRRGTHEATGHARPRASRSAQPRSRSQAAGPFVTRRGFLAGGALAGVAAIAACVAQRPASDPGAGRDVVMDQQSTQASELTVLMIGDVLVHQSVWESGEHADGTRSYDHLFANVADDVSAADVAMAGQETILAGNELDVSGYPAFCSPVEIGDAEVAAGFDVALCASNHACDRGMAGIEASLEYWRSEHPDMLVAGIADSEEAFEELPLIEREGHRIAVLNYASMMNGIPLPEPWAVRMLDENQVAADVAVVREAGAEAVVVCPHWGTEYMEGPDDDQLYWAQVLADAGADVIIGGHPHVLQPFETIQSSDGRTVPVFWSVGNFVSGQQRKDTMVGGMAHATFTFEGDSCRVSSCALVPVITNRGSGEALSTYRLADYTEEQAASNQIREFEGCSDFSRQWCVDFCSERLGDAFDVQSCELTWTA